MNVARVLTTLARRAPTTSVVPKRNYTPLERNKELQKQFTVEQHAMRTGQTRSSKNNCTADDGVPVHLKGGKLDVFLYQFTMACCAVGPGAGPSYKHLHDVLPTHPKDSSARQKSDRTGPRTSTSTV
uniref:Putative cytochrome c oxidase subunit viia n=1 Tax=Ixodes ricinus TaxID=34613 RepID=V5IJB7_IXORI